MEDINTDTDGKFGKALDDKVLQRIEKEYPLFTVKGKQRKLKLSKTDYIEIIENKELDDAIKYSTKRVTSSAKYPGKFDTNSYSKLNLEKAVEHANNFIYGYVWSQEVEKIEGKKVEQDKTGKQLLNTGTGIK